MNIILIVTGLLFILSIFLLSGKGSWLIAGYNTSSKEQQDKYDKEKLSRAAGVMLLIATIATLSLTLLHMNFIIFFVIIIISVIITIIYMNKYCLKPVSEDEKLETGPRQNNSKMMIGIGFAIIVALLVGISMYFSSKPPVYAISNGTLVISTQYGKNVNLLEIKSVQLKNDLPVIQSRINGLGLGSIQKGKFSSDIGNVTLYIDTSKPPFIYIKTTSELIILNDQSKSKTEALFDELNSDIKK